MTLSCSKDLPDAASAVGGGGGGGSGLANSTSGGASTGGGAHAGGLGGATSSTGGAGTSTSSGGALTDPFDGTGPLMGYVTNNPASLPDVTRQDGRYRANLLDNNNNITLHYNDAQGRLDAKQMSFPFDVVVRNIGIGTIVDPQTAPPSSGNAYIFAGVQVHVLDLESRNSSHVVVGHRGSTPYTVEGKNTLNGSSSVNDVGANAVPAGRADIRVVGNGDRTLTIYWQRPNPSPGSSPDDWNLYNGTGALPGTAPSYGASVYVGLITYAFEYNGIPFAGTCDGIEQHAP